MRRFAYLLALLVAAAAFLYTMRGLAGSSAVTLPSGWLLEPPPGTVAQTGTMPQGMALSPDGSLIAVVESGYNPPALSLYRVPALTRVGSVALAGAFGKPVWIDPTHVLVAGANTDALLQVDIQSHDVRRIALPKSSYPLFVAAFPRAHRIAVAADGDGSVRIGSVESISHAQRIAIGSHPGGLAFSPDGATVFASVQSGRDVVAIDAASSRIIARRAVGLHPSALLAMGDKLYVAETDADAIGVYSAPDLHPIATISVADAAPFGTLGVSPNALSQSGDMILATLGAANSVAVMRSDHLVGRIQAGWYPTDAFALRGRLYVLDGKGEGARPNPNFSMRTGDDRDYIGAIEFGSLRAYDIPSALASSGNPQGAASWNDPAPASILHAGGPVRHVFFVLKENRTYDQILGDMPQGNGDASLAWFGRRVTPNQHAIAARFGLFDNAYASGEVSSAGHMWADAAFANDFVERYWPPLYGNRAGALGDPAAARGPLVPAAGYLWDEAQRAHVSFRDYGELVDPGKTPHSLWVADVPGLRGRFDPRYAGWDLDVSDLDRVREWRREFNAFVQSGTLPQFEFVWLPNDHTYGSKAGKLTPAAYIATNDYALGQMVDTLSHSRVWKSSVLFAAEDDAQDGPDHVSDQRTTLYVASPYARGGVLHQHYATVSVLRTIELLLGMKPLSTYDAMASPMYAAFRSKPDLRPYSLIAPKIDVTRRNSRTAYGVVQSAQLDFSRPDAASPDTLNRILAHNRSP